VRNANALLELYSPNRPLAARGIFAATTKTSLLILFRRAAGCENGPAIWGGGQCPQLTVQIK
jgi:hypothetical protein